VAAPTLDAAEVTRVAALARLALSADEVELFTRQLADILSHVEQIRDVDTTGIAPMSHPFGDGPAWRADDPHASIDRDAILSQAPSGSPRAGLFKVPKVL
jgi:aspartyl-tRNA(Asn)/glutamyl-tRNA(Gln) amidotransferase subunit C